jgi:hypothetical protein
MVGQTSTEDKESTNVESMRNSAATQEPSLVVVV